jgi:hypothetical protein
MRHGEIQVSGAAGEVTTDLPVNPLSFINSR